MVGHPRPHPPTEAKTSEVGAGRTLAWLIVTMIGIVTTVVGSIFTGASIQVAEAEALVVKSYIKGLLFFETLLKHIILSVEYIYLIILTQER